MRAPEFWSQADPHLLARLLAPAGLIYSTAAELRLRMVRPFRPLQPVICIGNPTLGGAGKTPVAIAIARRLRRRRLKPGFLSRGYGATITRPTLVPREGRAIDYGDEPMLLAKVAPTVVSPNRAWGAELLGDSGIDVIVMDDGFQNPSITKDLSILVVDAQTGIGNAQVFPAGPLRMRIAPQIALADAVIVLGNGEAAEPVASQARLRGLPVIRGHLKPDSSRMAGLAGKRVFAFAGIGRPQKFFDTLRAGGADVVGVREFDDHHPYSDADAAVLRDLARARDAVLVTTQKDAVRLVGSRPLEALRRRCKVLPVTAAFDRVADHQLSVLLKTLPPVHRRPPTSRTIAAD